MEGRRGWTKDKFIDLVFSWSLQEIFDENLYIDKVQKIPDSFVSVDDYLSSYIFLLQEEMRSELASVFETANTAPFAEVTCLSESTLTRLVYDVEVDHWRKNTNDRGGESHRALPGNLLLITDRKPEADCDIHHADWTYTLVSVSSIADDKDRDAAVTSLKFKVRAANAIDVVNIQRKSLYVVHLMNMKVYKRIWAALRMQRNAKIIERVLIKNDMGEDCCEFCSKKSDGEMEEELGPLLSMLDASQRKAVLTILSKVECDHMASVELIWGPPGTGKTATSSVLLYGLLKMGVRTLVCAPTNVAITELASRVVALLRNSVEAKFGDCCLTCPLGDILIFGNKDNMKIGSNFEEIFLDKRVEMLTDCVTGWKQSVLAMLNFLENIVSLYEVYVENELIKENEGRNDDYIQKPNLCLFLDFAREHFARIAPRVRKSLTTLVTHLPRSYINNRSVQSIFQLMSLLECMKLLLFEDNNMTSEKLKSIFQQNQACESQDAVKTLPLMSIRSKCVSVLKSLQASLTELVTNRISTEESCFQKAQMIFCTVSTSFRLHSVHMEPFKLLVIDEAAQVKECESIIALQISEVGHAVLVGDECQLTATVSSKVSEKAGFGRSLFERLSSLGHPKHLLNMQYRMHPSISRFPNATFYCNQILDAPYVQRESHERRYLEGRMFGPYSFLDIRGGKEEYDDVQHSRLNLVEVAVAVVIVKKLFKAWNSQYPKVKLSIGVISPYNAQVAAIRDRLDNYANNDEFAVNVKSIDGFQGGEADIVIVSTVRSNKYGSIGFLSSPKRTNVALTRARHCLWILGNERTLRKTDSVWEAIIHNAKCHDCFFVANEDPDVGKTILDVSKELDQVDELLTTESIVFQNLRWKVLFSDSFRRSFKKLKPSYLKKLALNLLLKLGTGWRPKKINVDWACQNSTHVVKQFKVENYYIVCTIDLMKESTYYKQALRVWDILQKWETPKLLKRLDIIFAMFTDDFIACCNEKLHEGPLEVPNSWPTSENIIQYKNARDTNSSNNTNGCTVDITQWKTPSDNCSNGTSACGVDCTDSLENSKVNESLVLMKFYPLSTGVVNHLLSDPKNAEVHLPFEVTDEEREIIAFCRSCFILGRSGTGKTTVLTMKLFLNQERYYIASRDSPTSTNTMLHQLFVTVNPRLCYEVRKHVSQLQRFSSGIFSSDDNVANTKDIEGMAEFEDIPDTFVGIEQEKYPLIITLHKFLMMLDGTLGNSYFERFRDVRCSSRNDGTRSLTLKAFLRNKEVTFDRFRFSYWPHFNSNLTKDLNPLRVFTEIMSHIKGGLQDAEECYAKRSRQAYISLSNSRMSTLSEKKRDVIYDIFERYEKMKLKRGEFDLPDFVLDIHSRLKVGNLPGDKMDFIYMDEVQDLTLDQICLFRYICNNVDEGFVFSGDTAQTIARGIDFRFEDIRSLFYNEFLMKSRNSKSSGRKEKGVISKICSLSQNFRTHTGVLRLAQSVIDLLSHFFPLSIDVLPPESSDIYGEAPIFLELGSDEKTIISIFSASAHEEWLGFGADQAILVRDDSEKAEISHFLGHQALVLTILECKGLEFQDVLLYNFFGSSPMNSQWRVVYEFLKEKELLDADATMSFLNFSVSSHNILCTELKQLYVAITRTRQTLWICENNEEICKPMLDYWKQLNLVQVRKFDDSLMQAMQKPSSPEEWKQKGIKLFWQNNYEMAAMSFEKSGEEKWWKRAKASGLRAAASSLRVSNPVEARLREAAEIFDSIDRADSAAECFYDLGEYTKAGKIYLDKFGMSELRKAGECFFLARRYRTAAEVYAKGNFFNECLSACSRGNLFLLGVQYILSWKHGDGTSHTNINKMAKEFLEKGIQSHGMMGLSELMQCYIASKQCGTNLGEILSIQKLLHLHLKANPANFQCGVEVCADPGIVDEKILSNHVSSATLFHVWNLWKEKSLKILDCLDSLRKTNIIRCEGIAQFCFDHFGVRLQSVTSQNFVVLNPNAGWLKSVDKRSTLDACKFSSAAKNHWQQEFLSLGLRTLKVLESIYRISKYHHCVCLIYIFDIAKFFVDMMPYDKRKSGDDAMKLQEFLSVLPTRYFENAFPLDASKILSGNMVCLRRTQLSKNVLEKFISKDVLHTRNELNYRQMGRVAMILLGSGMPSRDVCGVISDRFSKTKSHWGPFIEILVRSDTQSRLSHELYKALEETYNIMKWRMTRDYISPHCFFYLVERLLILVPHPRGFFFAAKSSFIEYLLCHPDANPSVMLLTKELPDISRIVNFVFDCIQQCLNDPRTTAMWIKVSGIDCKFYFRLLLLRLFAILCLLCLNWGFSFDTVIRLLKRSHNRSQLPREFREVLHRGWRNDVAAAVAAAFQVVGNPVVMVCVGADNADMSSCSDILIDLSSFANGAEVVRELLARSSVKDEDSGEDSADCRATLKEVEEGDDMASLFMP